MAIFNSNSQFALNKSGNATPDKIETLPFYGGGDCPVQYELDYKGDEYYVRYRHSWLTIDKNEVGVFEQQLAHESADDGFWSAADTETYLRLISEAIIDDKMDELVLPSTYQIHKSAQNSSDPYRGFYLEKRLKQIKRFGPIYPLWSLVVAGLLGGSLGIGYFLHINYQTFKMDKQAKRVWNISLGIYSLLLLAVFIWPVANWSLQEFAAYHLLIVVLLIALAIGLQHKHISQYTNFGSPSFSPGRVVGLSIFFAVVSGLFLMMALVISDTLNN